MKTEFLNSLGIEDKEVIRSIMAENGRDVENAKKDHEELAQKVEGLESQLAERDKQLTELKKSAKDNEELTKKITELEENNKTIKSEYEGKLESMRLDSEIEGKLRDAKAKNVKAVRALIDPKGDLDEQIKTLKSGEDTGFLFETEQKNPAPPAGSRPAGSQKQPNAEMSFSDRISAALRK